MTEMFKILLVDTDGVEHRRLPSANASKDAAINDAYDWADQQGIKVVAGRIVPASQPPSPSWNVSIVDASGVTHLRTTEAYDAAVACMAAVAWAEEERLDVVSITVERQPTMPATTPAAATVPPVTEVFVWTAEITSKDNQEWTASGQTLSEEAAELAANDWSLERGIEVQSMKLTITTIYTPTRVKS